MNVLILTHYQVDGFAERLFDFFKSMYPTMILSQVFRADCPRKLCQAVSMGLSAKYFLQAQALGTGYTRIFNLLVHFLCVVFNCFSYRFRTKCKNNLVIATNPLNGFCAAVVLARYQIVYVCIDFAPSRSVVYRRLYLAAENYIVRKSTKVVCVSSSMIKVRSRLYSCSRDRFSLCPIGTDGAGHSFVQNSRKKNNTFCYIGTIHPKYNLGSIFNILGTLDNAPRIEVIGDGPQLDELRVMFSSMVENGIIRFHGHVQEKETIRRIVADCRYGFCFLDFSLDDFSRYADISKVKDYVSMDILPVLSQNLQRRYSGLKSALFLDPNDIKASVYVLSRIENDEMLADRGYFRTWEENFRATFSEYMTNA